MLGEIFLKVLMTETLKGSLKLIGKQVNPKFVYKDILANRIMEIVKDYRNKHPYDVQKGKCKFYEHRSITDEKLTKYVFFKAGQIEALVNEYNEYPEIIPTTASEINEFSNYFFEMVENDSQLKELFVEENYKVKIFEVDKKLDKLIETRENTSEIADLKALLINSYHNQLDSILDSINKYNPITALNSLKKLESLIEESGQFNNRIKAKLYFLKYRCYLEMGNYDESLSTIKRSNQLDLDNILYKEKLCKAELEFGQKSVAFKLSYEVLLQDKGSSIANAVKLIEDFKESDLILKNYPQVFKNDRGFKLILAGEFIRRRQVELLHLLFKNEIEQPEVSEDLTSENIAYYGTISTVLIDKALRKNPNNLFFQTRINYAKDPDLIKSNLLLEKYVHFYEKSEKHNFIKHYSYLLHYSRYLLTRRHDEIDSMLNIYHELDAHQKRTHVFDLSCSLAQIGKTQTAIQLIEQFETEDDSELLSALSSLYNFAGEKESAKEYSEKYIKRINCFDEDNLQHLIQHILNHCETREEKENIFQELKAANKFENEIAEAITECFSKLKIDADNGIVIERLYLAYKKTTATQTHYRSDIAWCLSLIGEYKKANEILESFIDFSIESISLKQYILNLFYSKNNSTTLLKTLKKWREDFSRDLELLRIEIKLLSAIPDWSELEKASSFGLLIEPDNLTLIFNKALSLTRMKLYEKAKLALLPIMDKDIPSQYVFHFASLLNEIGEHEMALEIIYRLAKDKENKSAREGFFSTYALLDESLRREEIGLAKEGVYGVFEIEGNTIRHEISIKNPIGNLFLGSCIGQTKEFNQSFTGKKQTIKLVKVINKYQALFLEIMEESSNNNFSGMKIQSLKFQSIEEFEKQMIEISGAEGTRNKIISEDIIQKYIRNEISFSKVVREIFNDKPIDAYRYLSNNETFRVLPKIVFNQNRFATSSVCVLDYTSLLLFESLSHELKLDFSSKFLISNFIIEHIERELYETENTPSPSLSLAITHERIVPHFYDKNFKLNRKDYFHRVLNWINRNCISRIVSEKLDVLRRLDEKDVSREPYFNYIIDTAFLASGENAILISDDSTFFPLLHPNRHMVNSETYFSLQHSNIYIDDIIPFLLDKNYLGISIYGKNLKTEFDKTFGLGNSSYNKCLRNLNPLISGAQYGMHGIIDFIKYVYLKPLLPDQKSRISQSVFSAWLVGINNEMLEKVYVLIKRYISVSFRLLPQYEKYVQQDFQVAINVTR